MTPRNPAPERSTDRPLARGRRIPLLLGGTGAIAAASAALVIAGGAPTADGAGRLGHERSRRAARWSERRLRSSTAPRGA